jgi:hypothetical protein
MWRRRGEHLFPLICKKSRQIGNAKRKQPIARMRRTILVLRYSPLQKEKISRAKIEFTQRPTKATHTTRTLLRTGNKWDVQLETRMQQ